LNCVQTGKREESLGWGPLREKKEKRRNNVKKKLFSVSHELQGGGRVYFSNPLEERRGGKGPLPKQLK